MSGFFRFPGHAQPMETKKMHATAALPRLLPRLLTAADLAEQFNSLSRQRIYELARSGDLPAIRIGRSYRFSAQAVSAWIASGGTAGSDEAA